MKNHSETIKQIIKSAINESNTLKSDCVIESLEQMDKLVQLHQTIANKMNESSKLQTVFAPVLEQISTHLENVEDQLAEQLSNAQNIQLNENEYGEGWMIRSQLYNIAKNALRLHKIVDEKEDFEDWIQAKITVVDDYMSTIAQFIEYRKMTVGNFDMDDKDQYNELNDDEDLSKYNNDIPLI